MWSDREFQGPEIERSDVYLYWAAWNRFRGLVSWPKLSVIFHSRDGFEVAWSRSDHAECTRIHIPPNSWTESIANARPWLSKRTEAKEPELSTPDTFFSISPLYGRDPGRSIDWISWARCGRRSSHQRTVKAVLLLIKMRTRQPKPDRINPLSATPWWHAGFVGNPPTDDADIASRQPALESKRFPPVFLCNTIFADFFDAWRPSIPGQITSHQLECR